MRGERSGTHGAALITPHYLLFIWPHYLPSRRALSSQRRALKVLTAARQLTNYLPGFLLSCCPDTELLACADAPRDDLHISRFSRGKNQTMMIVITGDGDAGETGSNVGVVPFQRASKFRTRQWEGRGVNSRPSNLNSTSVRVLATCPTCVFPPAATFLRCN